VSVDPRRIDRGLGGRVDRREVQGRGGTGDEEARAAARDDGALRGEPVIGLDDSRFRYAELERKLSH
jgi:hypothetical protein